MKCFEDADVLKAFKALGKKEQEDITADITSQKTEAKQIEQINHHINNLLHDDKK